MTAKQAEVWALYASGHTVTDIAKTLGRGKSTVSTMIKTVKERMKNPVIRESKPCEYSPSCFTCPLSDCGISKGIASRVNVLPGDWG